MKTKSFSPYKSLVASLFWLGCVHAADSASVETVAIDSNTDNADIASIDGELVFTDNMLLLAKNSSNPTANRTDFGNIGTGDTDVKHINHQAPVTASVEISHNYSVRGKSYDVLASAKAFQEIGNASWYGPGFHGKKTASGEVFNMYALTAAHKTLPLGSKVRVTNLENGNQVIVRINDRGPFHGGRVIDLSKAAAKKLGILKKGQAKVHVKAI